MTVLVSQRTPKGELPRLCVSFSYFKSALAYIVAHEYAHAMQTAYDFQYPANELMLQPEA